MSAINLDLNLDNKDANQALNEIIGGFTKLKKVSDDSLSSIDKQTKDTFNGAKLKKSSSAIEKMGKSFDILKKGITPIAIGIGVVTGAVAALGGAFIALARDQQKSQNLEALFKGSEESLIRMKKFAQNAGIEFETAQEAMLKLGRAFKPKDAEELLGVIGDLRVKSKLDPSGVANLTDEIAELGGKASVGNSDFEKFSKLLGSNIFKIDDIAKASGLSIAEVQKQIKEGTLSTVNFAAGLRQAGLAGEKVGDGALADAPKSIESQLNRIESIWENFKTNLFKAFGGGENATKILSGIADGLEKILSQENINAFFEKLGSTIKYLKDNFDTIKPILIGIGTALLVALTPGIISATVALGSLIVSAAIAAAPFVAIAAAVAGLYMVFDNWPAISKMFQDGLEEVVAYVKTIPDAFINMGKEIFGAISGIFTNEIFPFIGSLPEKFLGFGKDIMVGLYEGLLSGIKMITNVVGNIVNTIKGGFTSALQIKSPSKVFEQYGSYSGEGYADGLNKSNALVEKESSQLATNSKDALSKEQKEQLKLITDLGSDSGNSNLSMMPKQKASSTTSNINNSKTSTTNAPNIIINIEAGANVDQALIDDLKKSLGPKITNAYMDLMSRASAAYGN